MKKARPNKLKLNSETLRQLGRDKLAKAQGGVIPITSAVPGGGESDFCQHYSEWQWCTIGSVW